MKKTHLLILFVASILLGLVAIFLISPVEVDCHIPQANCAYFDEQTNRSYVTGDVEPRIVYMIETLTKSDFPYKYDTYSKELSNGE
jgi:hypothetical protein